MLSLSYVRRLALALLTEILRGTNSILRSMLCLRTAAHEKPRGRVKKRADMIAEDKK